jgi:hypothetical protein
MRKRIITLAKACSSTGAYSGTIETVSTLKPNALVTDREKSSHLDLVARSSGYLGTGNISSSVNTSPAQAGLTDSERYLCSVSKLAVDYYNKKNP